MLFTFSVEGRFSDFLEQDMRFAVDHSIALDDDGLPDGLGQVTFPGAGWTEKQRVLVASSNLSGYTMRTPYKRAKRGASG